MILDSIIPGMLSHIEGCILSDLTRRCEDGCIVNIGCFKGRSLDYIMQGDPLVDVYGIDIQIQREVYDEFEEDVILIEANSQSIATRGMIKSPIELLFIDGDHTFEGLKRDIEVWYSSVISGGIIIVHDFNKILDYHHQHEVQESTMLNLICPRPEYFVQDRFLLNSFIHRVDTMCILQVV